MDEPALVVDDPAMRAVLRGFMDMFPRWCVLDLEEKGLDPREELTWPREHRRIQLLLSKRAFIPGLFRTVSQGCQVDKFRRQRMVITTAAVVAVLKPNPTVRDILRAGRTLGADFPAEDTVRRLLNGPLRHIVTAATPSPRSGRPGRPPAQLTSVFTPNDEGIPDTPPGLMDLPDQRWVEAGIPETFQEAMDVVPLFWNAIPEHADIIEAVQRDVYAIVDGLGQATTPAGKALLHPLVVTQLATHISNILAVKWFETRGVEIQERLIKEGTPLAYPPSAAREAARSWARLASLGAAWREHAALVANMAVLASCRFEKYHQAAAFSDVMAQAYPKISLEQAVLAENAAIAYRQAGATKQQRKAMRVAVDLYSQLSRPERLLVASINLAESFAMDSTSQTVKTAMETAARILQNDASLEVVFWRNVVAAFRRSNTPDDEAWALEHLQRYFTPADEPYSRAVDRIRELGNLPMTKVDISRSTWLAEILRRHDIKVKAP